MWWFRGCSPTTTYKERMPCKEPGALCHQASCEATISKVLLLLWWSVAYHRRKPALDSMPTVGLGTPPPLRGLGFMLRQQALTSKMTGWRLRVPLDHDMVQIYKRNWSLPWLPSPSTKARWFTSSCPSAPTIPLLAHIHIMMLFFFLFLRSRI